MADQTHSTNADFQQTLHRLTETVDRLESALEQSLQLLKRERGIQLSVDLSGMVRAVRRDLSGVVRTVEQYAANIQQLQELLRTSTLINSSLEPDRVLEEVMDTVIHLTGAERGYLMLRDKDTGDLLPRTARNWERESLLRDNISFSRTIVNTAFAEGQPIVTNNAQDDPRFQGIMASMSLHGARSILCIPLIWRGQPVGVLYVDKRIQKGLFASDIVPIMSAFANQAAVAIENARQYSQVRADLQQAQREVMELRIQIDEQQKEKSVREITESEYFQEIELLARNLRRKSRPETQAAPPADAPNKPPENT